MKLKKTIKIAVTSIVTAAIVDMWRNWPWAKAVFNRAKAIVKD